MTSTSTPNATETTPTSRKRARRSNSGLMDQSTSQASSLSSSPSSSSTSTVSSLLQSQTLPAPTALAFLPPQLSAQVQTLLSSSSALDPDPELTIRITAELSKHIRDIRDRYMALEAKRIGLSGEKRAKRSTRN